MTEHGAAVSLFDVRQRETVWLPPAADGPVVVRFNPREADGPHSIDEERGIVFAEALCRPLLVRRRQLPDPRPIRARAIPTTGSRRIGFHTPGPEA